MSNLGGYKTATTVMKALGGPTRAVAILGSGLLIAGGALYAGGQQLAKIIVPAIKKRAAPSPTSGATFAVTADGASEDGFSLFEGERYRVLDADGDAVVIEVIGRDDNPQVASRTFLASISDYPRDAERAVEDGLPEAGA